MTLSVSIRAELLETYSLVSSCLTCLLKFRLLSQIGLGGHSPGSAWVKMASYFTDKQSYFTRCRRLCSQGGKNQLIAAIKAQPVNWILLLDINDKRVHKVANGPRCYSSWNTRTHAPSIFLYPSLPPLIVEFVWEWWQQTWASQLRKRGPL